MIFRCFIGNVQLPSFLPSYEVQDLGAQAHTCPLRYLLPLGLKIGGVKAGLWYFVFFGNAKITIEIDHR